MEEWKAEARVSPRVVSKDDRPQLRSLTDIFTGCYSHIITLVINVAYTITRSIHVHVATL